MTCRRARRLIQEWLNRELDPSQQEKLDRHLTRCVSCSREASSQQRLHPLLHDLEALAPPPQYWREMQISVLGRIERPVPSAKSDRPWYRPMVLAGTASACTFALGILVGFVLFGDRASAGDMRVVSRTRKPTVSSRVLATSDRRTEVPLVVSGDRIPMHRAQRNRPSGKGGRPRIVSKSTAQHLRTALRPVQHAKEKPRRSVLAVYRLSAPALGIVTAEQKTGGQVTEEALPSGTIVAPVAQRVFAPLEYVVVPELVRVSADPESKRKDSR